MKNGDAHHERAEEPHLPERHRRRHGKVPRSADLGRGSGGAARGKSEDSGLKGLIKTIWERMQQSYRGLPVGIAPTDVSRAGWAVVFAADAPAEFRDAIQPLIDHRKSQVPAESCKQLEYRPAKA